MGREIGGLGGTVADVVDAVDDKSSRSQSVCELVVSSNSIFNTGEEKKVKHQRM